MSAGLRVRIPQQHYHAFRTLLRLSPEQFEGLLAALTDNPQTLVIGDLVPIVASRAIIDTEDAAILLDMLVTVYSIKADAKLSAPDFTQVLLRALDEASDPSVRPTDEIRLRVETQLSVLLQISDPLGLIAKANLLWAEYDCRFLEAHIATDLRPLFKDDLDAPLAAAMIVHTLRLTHLHDDGRKEFFVVLDDKDITTLRKILDRAELKARSLAKTLEAAQVPLFTESGE